MNLSRFTTVEQVERYRREMAAYYHPDKWPADKKRDAEEVMKAINASCDKRASEIRWQRLERVMAR
jgi:DnaJ-class molecular chaperone